MAICNGCGGVVGRDCFNPSECEWISQDMERRQQQQYYENQYADRITELERQNAELSKGLTAEQVDRCRKLTLDYAIGIFEAKGGRMVNIAWVCEQLEWMKTLPLNALVLVNDAAPQQQSGEKEGGA